MARLELKIRGQVQGVGFRYAMRQRATQLGLTGFVRNEPDGTVTVVAEGNRQRLQIFLNWCYTGGRTARVAAIAPRWGEVRGEFDDFSIRYAEPRPER